LLWVIELAKKRVPIWTFSIEFKGKFWAQKLIWRQIFNPTEKLHSKKYFSQGHKRLAMGNRVGKKKGSYLDVFNLVQGNFWAL
jgi:hypothetical protein